MQFYHLFNSYGDQFWWRNETIVYFGMPAGNAYHSGHLVPSHCLGLAYVPIVQTSFPELSVSFLDSLSWIPHGTFSILLPLIMFTRQSLIHIKYWIWSHDSRQVCLTMNRKILNIVAGFRRMHVSPTKHSYAWLPRKCDYRTDSPRFSAPIPTFYIGGLWVRVREIWFMKKRKIHDTARYRASEGPGDN